jgi:hypothetical protein
MMDEHDGLDDAELAAALRDRADALTVDVLDTDAAFGAVTQRARARRFRRSAATGALAAAAAAVGVLVVTSVAGDEQVVRTPATSPTVPATVTTALPESTRVETTIASTTVPPVAPTIVAPNPSVATTAASQSPPPTEPATTPAPPSAPPPTSTVTTYDSSGGSIDVRLAGGAIALARDPSPRAGYSVRIDDNGPGRVRVRFEGAAGRSEIRVDLQGGELVPDIIEG